MTNWKQLGGPDAKIVVLDRPEDESAKKLLRKYYLGENLKNSPNAVVMRKENDLITAIQNTQHSIGAFSLGYAVSNKVPVNKLSLDGIECYPGELNQVFLNILNNAIDILDDGVGSEAVIRKPQIHIYTQLLNPEQIAICIQDNGRGMGEEVACKVFDPFFTTNPLVKGLG